VLNWQSWEKPLDNFDTKCSIVSRGTAGVCRLFSKFIRSAFIVGEALLSPNGGSYANLRILSGPFADFFWRLVHLDHGGRVRVLLEVMSMQVEAQPDRSVIASAA
jgi:hypothetical protein